MPTTSDTRTVVVTGAGSGIGRSIAQALSLNRFVVVLLGRHEDSLAETRESLTSPADALVLVADVTHEPSLAAAFGELTRLRTRLDVLVNNAGTFGTLASIEDVPTGEWDNVLAVNLTGAFRCTQHALHAMKKQSPKGGRIINIGSVAAHRPRPNSVAYAAAKHGLTGLSRSTALEGRDLDITCTQINVGNAATAMTHNAATGEATFDATHVGTIVAAIAALPNDVSVPELTMLAARMPYLGRG